MKMETIEPKYNLKKFTCPHCKSTTPQQWSLYNIEKMSAPGNSAFSSNDSQFFQLNHIDENLLSIQAMNSINNNSCVVTTDNTNEKIRRPFGISTCSNCNKLHLWLDEKMIEPRSGIIPPPNEDMNQDIKELYNEAAEVFEISHKSAGALLRLAAEKFIHEQLRPDLKGKKLNDVIKEFLISNSAEIPVIQELDYLRIVGNGSVHTISGLAEDNDKEYVRYMFDSLNFIVNETITEPKRMKCKYDSLPSGKRNVKEL